MDEVERQNSSTLVKVKRFTLEDIYVTVAVGMKSREENEQ